MSFMTIQDVHKSFYGKEILKGINLTIGSVHPARRIVSGRSG